MTDFNLQDLPSNKVLSQYAEQFPEADVLSVELCLSFLSVSRSVSDAYQVYYSKYGLSLNKFNILMLLYRAPNHELFPSELANSAGLTRGTITGILDGLEKQEWIKRKHSLVDRRKLTITLTDNGTKRLVQMLPDHYYRTSALMDKLSKEEKESLKGILNKIHEGTSVLYEKEEEI
ncbi:MarR family winged helix-turn-helix transcriptional regulator [Oceanobacillus jeddahense]|uniref:MarR family winged helix-turn-helix transcriptional regulator n=1 Tax=Oceanobacillus jeddahense TaxID=1462527 RepID=UPI0005960CB9|nr:MarR family transcriptional regulator [Oceanobacillus jeddahense]